KTIALLEQEGLLVRPPGKGAVVHPEANERLRRQSSVIALIRTSARGTFLPSLDESFGEAAGLRQLQVVSCYTNGDVLRQGGFLLQLVDQRVGGVAWIPPGDAP